MIFIFFQSLLISLILFSLFFLLVKKIKLENKLNRWGGIILIIVFLFLTLVHSELEITNQLKGLILGSVAILFFGIWDDFKNLSWKSQLIFQGMLVLILLYFGFSVEQFNIFNGYVFSLNKLIWQGISVFGVIFIFFWLVGIINAINWADGVDSSMGNIALFGGLSLVFVSFLPEVNQPAVAILASIFLGTIVAFLFFNLPPAKVEAGTSGSYFVGFFLASLAIIAGSKIITIMIVLVLPFAIGMS